MLLIWSREKFCRLVKRLNIRQSSREEGEMEYQTC